LNIALVGPRGVGKSKVSRKLSKITGLTVISTDMIATYEFGGFSIQEYIKNNGNDWRKFRDLEYSILDKLKHSQGVILDCGGGILFDLDEEGQEVPSDRKIKLLKNSFRIVRLNRHLEFLLNRVGGTSNRPNLSDVDSYSKILQKRNPIYDSITEHQIFINRESPEEIAWKIVKILGIKV
jgi:shikimate kinase